jgi:RNA polymerase sigma factor (sigma-70 family)
LSAGALESLSESSPSASVGRYSTEKDVEAQRLLGRLSHVDFATFYGIWEPYYPYLFKLCLRQMGGIREDAEDALCRAMLKAWERWPHHAHKIRHVKAWLVRLTLNLCTDIVREHKRQARIFENIDEMSASRQELMASPETPEEVLLRYELSFYLRGLIAALPPKLRDPFIMHFIHEMSYIDISAQLGLSTDNIRKRIQQARTILRNGLSKYDSGNPDPVENNHHGKPRRAGGNAPTFAEVGVGEQVGEITHQLLTLRLAQVILPSGVERSFTVNTDRRLSKRHFTRLKTLSKYVGKHAGGWKRRLNLADLLYETGQWREAVEQYRLVLKKPRRMINPYLRLGRILHLMERDEEAIEVYRGASLVVNNVASHHHLAGLIEVCRRRYDLAAREFQRASMLEPHNVNHKLEMGMIYLLEGAHVEALRAFDESLKIKPDEARALTYSCEALLNTGRLRESRQRITLALEINPENVPALKWLADRRSSAGLVKGLEGQRTRQLIKKALRLSPDSVQTHESLALYYLFRGEWVKSVSVLRTYNEDHPTCPEGWHYYAALLYRTGDSGAATEAIMKAHALHGGDWRIQQTACEILASAQKFSSLSTILEEIPEHSSHWQLWTAAGLALAAAGHKPTIACAIASRGPRIQPQLPQAWFRYGRVLALAGRHVEAVAAIKKGCRLVPEIGEPIIMAMAWLGESKRDAGEEQEARICWAEVLRYAHEFTDLNPARTDYWRGKALDHLDDKHGALLSYQSALQQHLVYPERQEALQSLRRLQL